MMRLEQEYRRSGGCTAVTLLTVRQSTRRVQELVKTLLDERISVIIISHNPGEVFALTNSVTVLLSGTLVGIVNSADVTKNDIVTIIVDANMPNESAVESSATS